VLSEVLVVGVKEDAVGSRESDMLRMWGACCQWTLRDCEIDRWLKLYVLEARGLRYLCLGKDKLVVLV